MVNGNPLLLQAVGSPGRVLVGDAGEGNQPHDYREAESWRLIAETGYQSSSSSASSMSSS